MTLVADASASVESALDSSRGPDAAMVMSRHEGGLHAPGLIMAESLTALRALDRRTGLDDAHHVDLAEALEAPLLTGDHRFTSATEELIEVSPSDARTEPRTGTRSRSAAALPTATSSRNTAGTRQGTDWSVPSAGRTPAAVAALV